MPGRRLCCRCVPTMGRCTTRWRIRSRSWYCCCGTCPAHTAQEDKEFHWRETLKHFPDAADAMANIGVIYSMRGQPDKAIEAGHSVAMRVMLMRGQMYQQALAAHARKPHHRNDPSLYWYNIGMAHLNMNRARDAATSFQHCIQYDADEYLFEYNSCRMNPRRGQCHEKLAEAKKRTGQ